MGIIYFKLRNWLYMIIFKMNSSMYLDKWIEFYNCLFNRSIKFHKITTWPFKKIFLYNDFYFSHMAFLSQLPHFPLTDLCSVLILFSFSKMSYKLNHAKYRFLLWIMIFLRFMCVWVVCFLLFPGSIHCMNIPWFIQLYLWIFWLFPNFPA